MMLNAYETYDDIYTKRCQIVYLKEIKNESFDLIANVTKYAVSTCRTYAKKFLDLLKEAKKLFTPKKNELSGEIVINCENNVPPKAQKCYLIRVYDEHEQLQFSKVGTTSRTIQARMKELFKSYEENGADKIVVDKIWDCGNIPPEGLESFFRSYYIKKFPSAFVKNDRFFNVTFDLNEAENLFYQYMTL